MKQIRTLSNAIAIFAFAACSKPAASADRKENSLPTAQIGVINLASLKKYFGDHSTVTPHLNQQTGSKHETIVWDSKNMRVSALRKDGVIVRFSAHADSASATGTVIVNTDRILESLADGKTWEKKDDTGYVNLRSDGALYALVSKYSGVSFFTPSEFKLSNKKLPFSFAQNIDLTVRGVFSLDSNLDAKPAGPIHPTGSIKKLSIQNVPVELIDEQITDGRITTKEFGDLEVYKTAEGLEFHGTDTQQVAIQKYLDEHKAPR